MILPFTRRSIKEIVASAAEPVQPEPTPLAARIVKMIVEHPEEWGPTGSDWLTLCHIGGLQLVWSPRAGWAGGLWNAYDVISGENRTALPFSDFDPLNAAVSALQAIRNKEAAERILADLA